MWVFSLGVGRHAPNTFAGSFHMSLGCRWAGYKIFLHCHCVQVWCSIEEACIDCFEYRHDQWVAEALVHKFDIINLCGSCVGESGCFNDGVALGAT